MRSVMDAARERMAWVFDNYDNVYVSFSGGKDSGVMLQLALDEYRKRQGARFGVFHIDYEAQYQQTTDYVQQVFDGLPDGVGKYHLCLPVAAQCATSMHQTYWIPWDKNEEAIWVRRPPPHAITEDACPFGWFAKGMWDYDMQDRFATWLHTQIGASRTACLVGIRTQESLNRWRAIHAHKDGWITPQGNDIDLVYPIHDWRTEDIWIANGRNKWPYNKLYDLFYMAGVPLHQMRVASPFNDCAKSSLSLYRVIDPNNWGKMIGRVNGVNFAGIYGGTTAMGWRSIKLPHGKTWKSYMEFLLSTLPAETCQNYKDKLRISVEFWRKTGGCLDQKTITELISAGVEINMGTTNRSKSKSPVRMEYLDEYEGDSFKFVPSYKRMCVCILKNDHLCKYMGFAPTKTETEYRMRALKNYDSKKWSTE